MKLKNAVLITLLIIFILVITIQSNAYAANSIELGILSIREGGYGYQANAKNVWKIVEYENGKYNYNNAIYCMKGGAGFGGSSYIENRTYNLSYDLKRIGNMPELIKNILPTDTEQVYEAGGIEHKYTNYNAVLWILDNIYLPKDVDAENMKTQLYNNVFPNLPIESILLTDDDIEVVQQCALWYFTNDNPQNPAEYAYHMDRLPALQVTTQEGGLGPFDQTLDDLDPTWERQTQAASLYDYLITNAKMNAFKYGKELDRSQNNIPAKLVKNDITAEIVKGKMIIGPYRIDEHLNKDYTLDVEITNQLGTPIEYKILNSNKEPVEEGTTFKDLVNSNFYISIEDNKQITEINFDVIIKYYEIETIFWTIGGAELIEQPIVIVEKKLKEIPDKITTSIVRKEFDLSLRKFITQINKTSVDTRIPDVETTPLHENKTTANYEHTKAPMAVTTGDIVKYTIRIYNEGEIDGYAEEICDYIPEGLGFLIGHEVNQSNYWIVPEDKEMKTVKLSTIPNATNNLTLSDFPGMDSLSDVDVVVKNARVTSNKLKYNENSNENIIKAYDKDTKQIYYKDIEVVCVVIAKEDSDDLKNIAEITKCYDEHGYEIEDRDSQPNNVDITKYPATENVQDDDDYEQLILKTFDLALRKFITQVDQTSITNRTPIPVIDTTTGKITYQHPKDIIRVKHESTVIYTIRVYNEGGIDGYASEIKDILPTGLEFIKDHEINKEYRWKVSEDGRNLTTDYLSKEQNADNLLNAFDNATMKSPAYKDVKVACKVTEQTSKVLINTAEIQNDSNKDGNDIEDEDSTPGNGTAGEDDIDTEKVQIIEFDLALRKFITEVNEQPVVDRVPVVTVDENGKITYTHTKVPVELQNKDIVIYTIRVYNEGNIAGYASEIKDDIPQGLIFLPYHKTNIEYGWNVDTDGSIRTNYLSEENNAENEIPAFNKTTMEKPAYKEVKVAFRVDETQLPDDRTIINTAEISKADNEYDEPDKDSTPNNNVEGEDDIDKEYVVVKYFDLSLLKWVTKVIITEDGKTTTRETGHTGLENPEPYVKVDLDRKKLKATIVDFVYNIKITNEGQIAGYAKEIRDDIPDGLRFIPEDNPTWSVKEDGTIVTRQLENTLLNPGESATVQIVLRWINDENNMGVKVNWAEISEDYNDSDSKDIDSTPNNKVPDEDDIDDATVLLSIKTGSEPMYLSLAATSLVILGVGIIFIKKYVLV